MNGFLGEFERMECVEHHGEFIGFLRTNGGFDDAGLRAMGNAEGMHGNRSHFDSFSGPEPVVDVVENLVAVDVAMHIGNGHGLGVKIERSRAETTNHEVVRFERLMDRRRHVKLTGDGTELVDVEGVGVHIPIPTDDIERVVIIHIFGKFTACLREDLEGAFLVEGFEFRGWANVSFGKRCVFEKLSVSVSIPLRDFNVTKGLDGDHSLGNLVHDNTVDGSPGDDKVIAWSIGDFAIHGLERSAAIVHEDEFVPVGVFEVAFHLVCGNDLLPNHVVIAHKGNPS